MMINRERKARQEIQRRIEVSIFRVGGYIDACNALAKNGFAITPYALKAMARNDPYGTIALIRSKVDAYV